MSHLYVTLLSILFSGIFMIPTKPPPSFHNPDKWSLEFIDFVSKCHTYMSHFYLFSLVEYLWYQRNLHRLSVTLINGLQNL